MTQEDNGRASIIVTGGNGRVGRLLVNHLRADGIRVISLARAAAGDSHPDDVEIDLTDVITVRQVLRNADADVLVHLASVLRGSALLAANERIDRSVALATAASGIRHIVLASSGSVYGTLSPTARTEESSLDGRTPYALSKMRTERIFRELTVIDDSVSLTTLRIFNLSGPQFADSLVQRLIRADFNHPVTVMGPDTFVRDYIYQDDLLAILREAISRREAGERIVNVGAGAAVSTRWLLESLEVSRTAYTEVEGDPTSSWTDNSRMVGMFGVVPQTMPDRSWDWRSPYDAIGFL